MTDITAPPPRWPPLYEGQRRVLRLLLRGGPDSRGSLADRLGLTRASLTRISRELIALGLVEELAPQHVTGRGRPREMLRLRADAAHILGVKLTGDTLYAVVTDLSGATVRSDDTTLVSREVGAVVDVIAEKARTLMAGSSLPAAVGVGLAGDVEHDGARTTLRRSSFLGWDDVPLGELVSTATGLPTAVSNDVHALAGAHHLLGRSADVDHLVVFGVGAGIGVGIVVGGSVQEGAHGRAGRVGHQRVGGRGRRCERGHTDCVHSFVSMPAVEANAAAAYEDVLARAGTGDERCLEVLGRAAHALGAAVADVVNTVDPQLVTLMGEGLHMLDVAAGSFRAGLSEYLEGMEADAVVVERPAFEFALYARGAAATAQHKLLLQTAVPQVL